MPGLARTLILSVILPLAIVGAAGCSRESANQSAYEGTVGDGMIAFIDTIDALADILASIQSLEDCAEAKAPLTYQIDRLRELHGVVGSLSVQSWAQMPRSLDKRRRAAINRFNAEAVRVMIKRERGTALRDVIVDVPALIYPELQN